jgi:hypothetical protein
MSMSSTEMCWRWELTPAELFAGFHFMQSEPAQSLHPEGRPFQGPKHPLAETPYTYQLALSDRSVAQEVIDLRRVQPDLPLSGDRRSGVLVFDGAAIVGSLVIPGNISTQGYKMFVRPDLRQQGLAFRMLVEWCTQTKRYRVLPKQGITVVSARALLAAHKVVVQRAVQAGKPVPPRVLEALAQGTEAQRVLAEATRIEALELPKRPSFSLVATAFVEPRV